MTDKKGFDVDEQPAKICRFCGADIVAIGNEWAQDDCKPRLTHKATPLVAEPAKEVQPAKAASVEGVSDGREVEQVYPQATLAICTCGDRIVHLRDEFWRKEATGEVCKKGHWHGPDKSQMSVKDFMRKVHADATEPAQGSGERELPQRPETCNEIVLDYMDTLEAKLESALAEIQQLKEVQPSMQFEEWWAKLRDSKDWEAEDISDQTIARAAWQAALAAQSVELERLKKVAELHNDAAVESWQLTRKWQKRVFELEAAQSAPVDWEKVVREKFPNASIHESRIYSNDFVGDTKFLGYSWQHAAHHPDVIGGGK